MRCGALEESVVGDRKDIGVGVGVGVGDAEDVDGGAYVGIVA